MAQAGFEGTEDLGRRVRRWLARLNGSRRALWLLFAASFVETMILPIPIELVLIPFMVANRHRLWRAALVATAGCLPAALIGYGIGYFLFEAVGRRAIDAMDWQNGYDRYQALFDGYGFWAVLALIVTPAPFQLAMLAAGAAGYPLAMTLLAVIVGRGGRYLGVAVLVWAFGDRAVELWARHRLTAAALAVVVLGAAFGLSRWLGGMLG